MHLTYLSKIAFELDKFEILRYTDNEYWKQASILRCSVILLVSPLLLVRTCPQILDLVSGSCSGSTSRFSTIKCSCAPGYILSGKEVIRCQTGARWSIPMMGSNYPRCTCKCNPYNTVLYDLMLDTLQFLPLIQNIHSDITYV